MTELYFILYIYKDGILPSDDMDGSWVYNTKWNKWEEKGGEGAAKWVKGFKCRVAMTLDVWWGACNRVYICQIIFLCTQNLYNIIN